MSPLASRFMHDSRRRDGPEMRIISLPVRTSHSTSMMEEVQWNRSPWGWLTSQGVVPYAGASLASILFRGHSHRLSLYLLVGLKSSEAPARNEKGDGI